jgi:hypothetical protein
MNVRESVSNLCVTVCVCVCLCARLFCSARADVRLFVNVNKGRVDGH